MSETVWKYRLAFGDTAYAIPAPAEIVSVGEQAGDIVMWVRVDTEREKQIVLVNVINTGQPLIESPDRFIGTVQMADGLVRHVFSR